MSVEKFANGSFSTTLDGSITNSQTTLTVASATGFPSSGNFRIRVDDEIILVTSVSGATFTVTRGSESTTAASHLNGAPVNFCLTAASLENAFADVVSSGAWASRPSGSFDGQIYIANDSPLISRYTGSAWEVFGLTGIHKLQTSGFSQVNGGTLTTTEGRIKLVTPAGTADEIRMYVKSVPGSTPYQLVARLFWAGYPADYFHAGLCWRDSASGNIACHGVFQTSSACRFFGQKFSGPSSGYNSDYGTFVGFPRPIDYHLPMNWMRLRNDGTSRIFSLSSNGRDWITSHSIGNTDYLTPDQFGIFIKAMNNVESTIACDFLEIS